MSTVTTLLAGIAGIAIGCLLLPLMPWNRRHRSR